MESSNLEIFYVEVGPSGGGGGTVPSPLPGPEILWEKARGRKGFLPSPKLKLRRDGGGFGNFIGLVKLGFVGKLPCRKRDNLRK
jgi:hypothetical protein